MDLTIIPWLLLAGFAVGSLVFSLEVRWVGMLLFAFKERTSSSLGKLVLLSLLSSGPWVLVVIGVFAYYEYRQLWARWVFVGFCAALVVHAFQVVRLLKQRSATPGPPTNAA